MDKRSFRYLKIVAVSFLSWVIVVLIHNSTLGDVFVVRQLISILPNFLAAIIVPFGLIALIRLVTKTSKELRIFYYILFAVLIAGILYEYILSHYYSGIFDIYDIIASTIGIFVDMVVYDRFETEYLRKYKVETNKGKKGNIR